LSTILVLSFFCLVLVLSKQGKQCVASIFDSWRRLGLVTGLRSLAGSVAGFGMRSAQAGRAGSPHLTLQNIPLQI
jgi:hypothetical protein